ncbi:MAG: hypothetical protein GYB64_17365 [Chloroflexi bacterium]|nr:hypothetical protein [Chloroflexota bacterium]
MTVALLFGQMAFAALPRIDPVQQEPAEGESENFHAQLDVLEGPFESGPEVTAACLSCHEGAAEQIMATSHWTWEYEHPVLEETVGKVNVINNYCVSVRENEPRCTSCHVGYGWADDSFDFTDETAVD